MKPVIEVALTVVIGLAVIIGAAQGAIRADSQFFPNVQNLASDDDAEYFIDLVLNPADPNPDGSQSRTDVPVPPSTIGDLFVGSIRFLSVEDNEGLGGIRFFGTSATPGVEEMVGIFAIKAVTKTVTPDSVPVPTPPDGNVIVNWAPVTPADTLAASLGPDGLAGTGDEQMSAGLKAELDSWVAGTMVTVYSDPANDWTRAFNAAFPGVDEVPGLPITLGDDGDPAPLTGADIGVGPFAAEESLLSSAYLWPAVGGPGGATKLLELGFTGLDLDGDGAPNAGPGQGWLSNGTGATSDDVKVLRTGIPGVANVGTINFGIDVLLNGTGWPGYIPQPSTFGGTAQFVGNSNIQAVAGINTPFDTYTDTNVKFEPIPEPATILVWAGLALAAFVLIRRARRPA